ncbi:MAG: AAA family ATPase [Bacteroidia bacterium]|nr:AAA family ATPase [Bacteroidia bacterium]
MRIFSIELENFRMFEKKRVEFPAMFSVLIGENGTGKTSILEAIAGLLEIGFVNEIEMLAGVSGIGNSKLVNAMGVRYTVDDFGNKERARSFSIMVTCQDRSGSVFSTGFFLEKDGFSQDVRDKDFEISQFEYPNELIYIAKELFDELQSKKNPILPVLDIFGTDRNLGEPEDEIDYIANASRIENGYFGSMRGKLGGPKKFLSWFKTFENEAIKFPNKLFVREHLDCVKEAILSVLPNWTDLSFSFPEDDLIGTATDENGIETRHFFRQLSDGYRSMVALVGTIAWRCVRLNPHLGKNAAKESPGIILIDELDLHLHPNWQKRIVGDLKRTFPNIQFICTTHSPFIVQSLEADEIISLDGIVDVNPSSLSLEDVAEEIMGVESPFSIENQKTEEIATKYLEAIDGTEKGTVDVEDPGEKGLEFLGNSNKETELNELEQQISDPVMRAFLQMQRLKYKK